jgi:exosortase
MSRNLTSCIKPATLPPLLLLVAVGVTLAWAYAPALAAMAQKWTDDPQYSHGFLVPPFVLFLLWTRRRQLPVGPCQPSAWGLALLAGGAALRLTGAFAYVDWLEAVSLLPSLAGLSLLVGGWPLLRWAWPAIAFLLFMIPLPSRIEASLAEPLQRFAAVASSYTLQALGRPAGVEGNVIVVDGLRVEVAAACSGLGSLFVFFALATGLALLVRRPLLDRLLLVLSAAPIALVANVVRITLTVVLHDAAGGRWAYETFHELAGWFMMLLALGLLRAELWLLDRLFVSPARPSSTEDRGSRIEDRGSRIEDRGSRIEDRGSRIEDRGSRIEDRESKSAKTTVGVAKPPVPRSSILDPRSSILGLLLALALVLLQGLVHGWWTDRWTVSEEPGVSAARLADVPLTVGEWDGEALALDPHHQAIGEIRGYLLRRYVHRSRKTVLSVLLVCGRPGPISVHTPDVCYRGSGFAPDAPPERRTVETDAPPAEFWTATFRQRDAVPPTRLCIFWAWNDKAGWRAVDYPRLTFARAPALYKLYVVRETAAADANDDALPVVDFLQALLPALDKALFTGR